MMRMGGERNSGTAVRQGDYMCGRREGLCCVSANENVVQCKNLPEELVFSALGLHCQVAEKVRNVCYLIAV